MNDVDKTNHVGTAALACPAAQVHRAAAAGALIRKVISPTLYKAFPEESTSALTFPDRIASNAATSRGRTLGDATGILCAPNTSFTCRSSAASRRIDAAYASRSVSGR